MNHSAGRRAANSPSASAAGGTAVAQRRLLESVADIAAVGPDLGEQGLEVKRVALIVHDLARTATSGGEPRLAAALDHLGSLICEAWVERISEGAPDAHTS